MTFPVSVGDVVLLGSLAWKIGRAFTSGRAGAPAEFSEVENELQSLTTALNILVDTLEEDDSILARANRRTVNGLGMILLGCSETLKNLDSLVLQYQEICKSEPHHAISGPRVWRQSVLRNYKKLLWTSEGGNIQALRNMLEMHVGSISMMVEALQSQSLARIENTIHPLACKVDGIHNSLVGNIDIKVAEMHSHIMGLLTPGASPSLDPLSRRDTISSVADTLVGDPTTASSPTSALHTGRLKLEGNQSRKISISDPRYSDDLVWRRNGRTSSRSSTVPSPRTAASSSPDSSPYETPLTDFADGQTPHKEEVPSPPGTSQLLPLDLPLPAIAASNLSSNLALPSSPPVATQTSKFTDLNTTPDETHLEKEHTRFLKLATPHERRLFEHAVFNDAVTLCKRSGISVDYTQRTEREDIPQEEATKVVQVTKACSISLVTTMRSNSLGRIRHSTSIWVLSEDGQLRMQQQLDDDVETIPYTVWGNTTSVVLPMSTELEFHDTDIDDKPLISAKTSWVNYHFQDEKDSMMFQSALMWKRLLYSFRTQRTMLAHEGLLTSAFSLKEQLCVFENLRLWRDDEAGSTVAMIHYSPSFHEGYLTIRLSGPGTVAKIVDDGDKWVKIKKLNIVFEPKAGSRSSSTVSHSSEASDRGKKSENRKISAVRIEFSSAKEKYKFLEVYNKAKER